MLEPIKKDTLHSKTKKKPQGEGRRGTTVIKKQISYMPGGWTTNWKIIVPQEFSHRSESSEACIRLPSLGGLAMGGGDPRESGIEGQQCVIPQDWGKQKLHSWRVYTGSRAHQDPGEKPVTS